MPSADFNIERASTRAPDLPGTVKICLRTYRADTKWQQSVALSRGL